ncbi:TetR/AcrR family transcriptional regulator [Comamonas sp.]|uniref:TetR/AcrR family transcriptional regulator n=1 Tax=Comamonas sp. TaxID=34028 RepID=UPI002FCA2239
MMTVKSKPTTRTAQRDATRQRIVDAAVASLIERGSAATTTVEVQERAQVSRGALLHHFPSHAQLLAATIEALVARNEDSVRRALALQPAEMEPVDRATRALAEAFTQPAYLAELELWAVARTDANLRESLRDAERQARRDFERVVSELFASVKNLPAYTEVVALSMELLRGMALACLLREDKHRQEKLLQSWSWAVRILLKNQPDPPK